MGRIAPLVDALFFVGNRKTVSHSDFAGLALGVVFLSPPVHQTKPALSFAGISGTRRGVGDECGIEESEEFPKEGLQRWD
jgi:hypothetical protein